MASKAPPVADTSTGSVYYLTYNKRMTAVVVMVVIVIKASGLWASVVGDCCFWMLWRPEKN